MSGSRCLIKIVPNHFSLSQSKQHNAAKTPHVGRSQPFLKSYFHFSHDEQNACIIRMAVKAVILRINLPRSLKIPTPNYLHYNIYLLPAAANYYIQASGSSRQFAMASSPPRGYFTILYFASASSHTSKDSEFLPAPLALSTLFDTLEERYPGIKAKVLDSSLVTVNLEYIDIPEVTTNTEDTILKDGDEVAIIPPVSSG